MPTANAGPDRSCLVGEPISIDGTSSSGGFDGLQPDGGHSYRWDFGYADFTYEGGLTAPVAFPEAGVYTVTLTVYDSLGASSVDTMQVTVSDFTLGTENVLTDTGNSATNLTNLQSEIDSRLAEDNPVTTLPVGFVWSGTLTLKHRTSATYHHIRTAGYASLPNSLTRVATSDATNMAVGEVSNNSSIVVTPTTSASPAQYYRFLGIHFRKAVDTFQYNTGNFVWLGQADETSLSQLPNHIQFDRCYFDGGSTTSDTLRGLRLQGASDIAVMNSYFHRFKGVGIETQAIFIAMGERLNVMNNYLSAATEVFLSGGAGVTITNHLPTDMVFRRNHFKKETGWFSGSGDYYGVNFSVKNIFELKTGRRISVQGNYMENHWQEDQDYALAITVRGENGSVSWAEIANLDFAHNKVHKVARGVHFLASDDGGASGNLNRILFRHIIWTGISFYNGTFNTYTLRQGDVGVGPSGGSDRVYIIKTSTDQNGDTGAGQGRWFEFDNSDAHTNLFIRGNVGQGYFAGSGSGTSALNTAAPGPSWTVTENGLYRSIGTNPGSNTTAALIADVKFTDLAGYNLKLASDSPFLTAGIDGGRAGADTDAVDTLTTGSVSGVWSSDSVSIVVCKWSTSPACQ